MINHFIITVLLKQDVHFRESSYRIGQLISKSLLGNKKLKQKHRINEYKYYVYDNLNPINQSGIYKKNRIYIYNIRTPDSYMSENLDVLFNGLETDFFRVIAVSRKQIQIHKIIKELRTVTPVVMTIKNGYWKKEHGIHLLKEGINNNILKKYKQYYGEIDDLKTESFFDSINILSRKPIGIKYKKITFLSHNIKLNIKLDEASQHLAKIAIAAGLLEKNSACGMGYCNWK